MILLLTGLLLLTLAALFYSSLSRRESERQLAWATKRYWTFHDEVLETWVRQPATAFEMLDLLDGFLAQHVSRRGQERTPYEQNEAVRLWVVLSALRGPDAPEHSDVKALTTAPLRAMALPATRRAGGDSVLCDFAPPLTFTLPPHGRFTHFYDHACRAHQLLRERSQRYQGAQP